MRPVTPVLPGFEKAVREVTIAEDQPQYLPLPSILVPGKEGEVITRWELTNEEKVLLLSGGHIYLSLWTFGGPLQPILLRVATPDMVMDEERTVQFPREDLKPDVTTTEETPPS